MTAPTLMAIMFVPSAVPSWPAGKASVMIAAALALSRAAPEPCRKRKMTSCSPFRERPQRSEPTVKTAKRRSEMNYRPFGQHTRPFEIPAGHATGRARTLDGEGRRRIRVRIANSELRMNCSSSCAAAFLLTALVRGALPEASLHPRATEMFAGFCLPFP